MERGALADSGDEQRLIRPLPRKGIRFVGRVHIEQGLVDATANGAPSSSTRVRQSTCGGSAASLARVMSVPTVASVLTRALGPCPGSDPVLLM